MLTEIKGYLIAAGAVAVLALLVGAYFYGEHRIEIQDASKFAAIAQQAKDAQARTDEINTANKTVSKDAYNELQTKLAGYSSTVDDLTQRLRDAASAGSPVIVSGPMVATCKPADKGPARAAGTVDPGTAEAAPAEASTLPTEVLRDDLTLALQNIEALRVVIEESDKVQR